MPKPTDETLRTLRVEQGGDSRNASAETFLHVVSNGGVFSHPLPRSGSVVIGRSREADLRIDDPAISRRHAIVHVGPPMTIEDLGSANGLTVAKQRLAANGRANLEPGTVIEIGGVMMVVQRAASAARPRRIWSHGYFEGRVEDECARAQQSQGQFALLCVHVARGVGESTATEIVSGALRAADILATYGPGELEALIVDASPDEAHAVAAAVVDALAKRGVEARHGLACFPRDARAPDELVASAREALNGPPSRSRPGSARVFGTALRDLEPTLERVARGSINVLVTGETGVGKELVAELVHRVSPRHSHPLVRINCAALSETLLASELFGHERGAFTGADRAKPGLLESADGGTVFLDEVGELPQSIQPKLLRVLEDKHVVRVGALKGKPVDVRFVAATNRDLEAEVAHGRFRQDLYFRLNGFHVHVPPLRERRGEIADLARGFVELAAKQLATPAPALSTEALDVLVSYHWPGNVRELRNVIERAVLLCGQGTIRAEHLPLDKMSQPFAATPVSAPASPTLDPLRAALDAREKQRVVDALAQCGGNQTHAARLLGISRGTLLSRMDAYGITRPRKR